MFKVRNEEDNSFFIYFLVQHSYGKSLVLHSSQFFDDRDSYLTVSLSVVVDLHEYEEIFTVKVKLVVPPFLEFFLEFKFFLRNNLRQECELS